MSVARKRFISGAICPHCNTLDTLALWCKNRVAVVECVKCGHRQHRADEQAHPSIRRSEQVIDIFRLE